MKTYKYDEIQMQKVQEVIAAQTDGVLALRLSILLFPSTADKIKASDLPGYVHLHPKQIARIRQLMADKDNILLQNKK